MSGTRRKAGLLGSQVEGYRAWLLGRGYTPGTVRNMLKDLGQVGRWSAATGLELAELGACVRGRAVPETGAAEGIAALRAIRAALGAAEGMEAWQPASR